MISKEDCEMKGKIFVDGYKRDDGVYVKPYCRDQDMSPKSIDELSKSHENFALARSELDETGLGKILDRDNIDELASRNIKLPKNNTANARKTYGSIKSEQKQLGGDLRNQDFQDAEFQSMRISQDAEKEAQEDSRLSASQLIKSNEAFSKQKKKIATREYKETTSKIENERKATKKGIKGEKKRIRHEKRQNKREEKLRRLQSQ